MQVFDIGDVVQEMHLLTGDMEGISVKNTFFTRKFVSAHTCHKFVMHKERVQK